MLVNKEEDGSPEGIKISHDCCSPISIMLFVLPFLLLFIYLFTFLQMICFSSEDSKENTSTIKEILSKFDPWSIN